MTFISLSSLTATQVESPCIEIGVIDAIHNVIVMSQTACQQTEESAPGALFCLLAGCLLFTGWIGSSFLFANHSIKDVLASQGDVVACPMDAAALLEASCSELEVVAGYCRRAMPVRLAGRCFEVETAFVALLPTQAAVWRGRCRSF